MRAVLLIVDALPLRHVGPSATPHLHDLTRDGGVLRAGRSVLTSATYPNHATFATGAAPVEHGLFANWVVRDGVPHPAWRVGPAVPTLFDAASLGGRSSACVVGDHRLIGVMGAEKADTHWPPAGRLPEDLVRDAHGYAADAEVLTRLAPLLGEGGPDLVVGHLNEPDTAAHVYGPDSEAALAAYRSTDAVVGELLEELRPGWDDLLLVILSDHDQETLRADGLIDPYACAPDGVVVVPEGSAMVAWGADPAAGDWLDALDGVAGHVEAAPGVRIAWAEPGRGFALPSGLVPEGTEPEPGQHGGMSTRTQVCLVAGGHPQAVRLAAALAERRNPVPAAAWAPTLADALGLVMPQATGASLSPRR